MTTPTKEKGPMDTPDYQGQIGPYCPKCEKRGIKVRTKGRAQKGTGKLYFGCPNYPDCNFNGCRDT